MKKLFYSKVAVKATLHCLTGCAMGETLGVVIGSSAGWSNMATAMFAVLLAFIFGYALTMRPLLKHGLKFRPAIKIALAADTLSIMTMEIVDTLIILSIPGAIEAGPANIFFWFSLVVALGVAFIVTVPVNHYLIARGKGHAIAHQHHH